MSSAEDPPVPPDDDDVFPDEVEDDASRSELAAMLLGGTMPNDPEPGTVVTGTVIQLGAEELFLDIGAKSEAVIERAELVGEDGELTVGIGDKIEASVVSVKDNVRVSQRMLRTAKSRADLEDAYASGMPVEGRVESVRKGGFDIALAAGLSAFCPLSQIDQRRVEEPETWVGRTLEFLVVEVSSRGRNIVVSRRKVLERESEAQAEETRKTLAVGSVLPGRVASIKGYGAFVDIGGVQGLVHVSEISHTRLRHPSEALAEGDEVTVKVLRLEEGGKIALGMKQLAEDPWETIGQRLPTGIRVTGKVRNVAEFGAFVELLPGIEGLVHVSELSGGRKDVDARQLIETGADIEVAVLSVDADKRRISLARVDADDPSAEPLVVGAIVDGKVSRIEPFGVFVRLGPGVTGLVPNEEMGTARGADHRKEFPPDTPMKVEVLAIEEDGKRIRLSRQAVAQRAERMDIDSYLKTERAQQQGQAGSGFSILGDALRDKLDRPDSE